jgi:hypothetical protein
MIERESDESLVVVATDGRSLVAASWRESGGPKDGEPLLLGECQCQEARKAIERLPKSQRPDKLELSEAECRLSLGFSARDVTSTFAANKGEGRFPRWRDVVPEQLRSAEPAAARVCVDLVRLRECIDAMIQVASKVNETGNPVAVLILTGEETALCFSVEGEETQSFALLMPMVLEIGGERVLVPTWIPHEAKKP